MSLMCYVLTSQELSIWFDFMLSHPLVHRSVIGTQIFGTLNI